jgi:hypothetical protein
MSLVEQLRGIVATMPPGSSVSLPIDWLRQELERSGNGGAPKNGEVEVDYSVQKVAELWGRRPGTVRDWIRSGRLEGYLFNRKGVPCSSGRSGAVPRGAAIRLHTAT